MGWKSKKDGTHFNDDKTYRDSSKTPDTEVNIEIDNNSDDFAEAKKLDFNNDKYEIFDDFCNVDNGNGVDYTQYIISADDSTFHRHTDVPWEEVEVSVEKDGIIKFRCEECKEIFPVKYNYGFVESYADRDG